MSANTASANVSLLTVSPFAAADIIENEHELYKSSAPHESDIGT